MHMNSYYIYDYYDSQDTLIYMTAALLPFVVSY